MATLIDQLKLRRDLWDKIGVYCKNCGTVSSFAQRMKKAKRRAHKMGRGMVWSECPACGVGEAVYDPGVAMILRGEAQ